MQPAKVTSARQGRLLLGVFLLLSGALGLGGDYYFRRQRQAFEADTHSKLQAIADLKAQQIDNWRQERINDATFFIKASMIRERFRRYLAHPEDAALKREISEWLALLQRPNRYEQIFLLDGHGRVRLGYPAAPPNRGFPAEARDARRTGFSELYRDAESGRILLDLFAPLPDDSVPAGALLFRIDPERFLYPLIQSWPTPSATAETLLIRRDGDQVVYLNPLRHRADTALRLRHSIREPNLSAVMAARGQRAVFEGLDYRGVPVLAAARPIAGADWIVVAKIDRDEVYGPLSEHNRLFAGLLGVGWISLAFAAGLLWKRREAAFALQALQHERQAGETIHRLTDLYAALSQTNQAIVRIWDEPALFTEVCRIAVEFGKMRTAWVGWIDAEARTVVPVAHYGKAGDYVAQLRLSIDPDRPEGNGPTGTAMREDRLVICNDFLRDPRTLPWRNLAFRAGLAASLVAPLHRQGRVVGSLNLYAATPGFFTPDVIALIEEMALDISFALDNHQRERERQRVAAELRQSEERFALFMRHLPGYAFIKDVAGNHLYVNEPLEQSSGLPREAWLGRRVEEIWPGPVGAALAANDRQALAAGRATLFEEILPEQGVAHIYLSYRFPIPQADGSLCLGGIAIDISAQKRAEDEVRRLNADLERRVEERTFALTEANKDLEAFSYSVSHDLRAPLRAITGFAEIIQRRYSAAFPEEARHYLGNILVAGERMGHLIEDLLDYSRVGRHTVKAVPVDLGSILRQVVTELQPRIDQSGAEVRLEPDYPTVQGDRTLLAQVLSNLLDNALRYHPPGSVPEVGVRATVENGEVILAIRDNGIGIAPEHHARIFQMFQRLHSDEEYPGTGVGLAIVKKALDLMHARISVESAPGRGSTFSIRLNRAEPIP
jgi:PAS domain S-box-containing protein